MVETNHSLNKHKTEFLQIPELTIQPYDFCCFESYCKKQSFASPISSLRRLDMQTTILHNVSFTFICI